MLQILWSFSKKLKEPTQQTILSAFKLVSFKIANVNYLSKEQTAFFVICSSSVALTNFLINHYNIVFIFLSVYLIQGYIPSGYKSFHTNFAILFAETQITENEKMKDLAILIMRLVFGGLMLPHGYSKLMKLFGSWEDLHFADPFGMGPVFSLILAVFAECICSILIMVGFKTRFAIIPLIVTMIVAAFVVHGGDPLAKKELALLYLTGYLAIALWGSGKYSVDGYLSNRK